MEGKDKALFEELQEATAPAREFLAKHYDMMCEIRVTTHSADVLRQEMGTGVIEEDDE